MKNKKETKMGQSEKQEDNNSVISWMPKESFKKERAVK